MAATCPLAEVTGARLQACQSTSQALRGALEERLRRRWELERELGRIAEAPDFDGRAQELSRSYRSLRVAQEEHFVTESQAACREFGHELTELESQVMSFERGLWDSGAGSGDLRTLLSLADLERRRGVALERQVTERSGVWRCLAEQQALLDEHRQLSSIYSEELAAAGETVEALKVESEMWRSKVFEESSSAVGVAASRAANRLDLVGGNASGIIARPSGSDVAICDAGLMYARALCDAMGKLSSAGDT